MNSISNSTSRTTNTRLTHPATRSLNAAKSNATSSNTISPERKAEIGTPRQQEAPGHSKSPSGSIPGIKNNSNADQEILRVSKNDSPLSPPDHRRDFDFGNLQKTLPETPQYDNDQDHTYLDSAPLSPFFRASPKVTPARYAAQRTSSFPPPKYSSNTMSAPVNELDEVGPSSGPNTSVSARHSNSGVETILRASASTDFADQPHNEEEHVSSAEGSHISPTRVSQRNMKVSVVSPPEDEPRRGPSMQIAGANGPGYDLQHVPDSPYSHSYYQGHGHNPGQYPPPSGYQHPRARNAAQHPASLEDPGDRDRYAIPPPYYPPPYGYGYDRSNYEAESYGKRPRPNEDSRPNEGGELDPRYPGGPGRHYYDRPGPGVAYPPYYRPSVSESFESGSEAGSKRSPRRSGPPPVSKAPSYPPPPSPTRYGVGADSSAASYPGARRNHGGSDYSYNNPAIYSHSPHPAPHGAPPPYASGESRYPPPRFDDAPGAPPGHPPPPSHAHDYYRDPRSGYPGAPPPGYYEGPGAPPSDMAADYYARGQAPAHEEHPLLNEEKHSLSSPSRRTKMSSDQSVGSNKDGSPNKPKPSTTAQAAIAAGMTEPPSAKEVNFDINNPPLTPITPQSTRPICTQSSEVNIHDVLCGRGGGTNTQIGNRRFRSLVQEFQPTYLLCRRKEKPLIARTIVLIVRNRGGRFLKKQEDEGAYYEVGDEKAEAKTSQALREGLDVRASRSSIDGKKKPARPRKKKIPKKNPDQRGIEEGAPMTESPRRDGPPPPPRHDSYGYPHPPPPYGYYGYDPYYPPAYGPGYGQAPYSSPSRKRQRGPPTDGAYDYPHYPPTSPYKSYSYQYPEHYGGRGPPGPEPGREEDNPMWEVDFSPPRTNVKKQSDLEH